MNFDGETYDEALDRERLSGQLMRTRAVMWDSVWRTCYEISAITGDPPTSISSRLRDFRKKKFGGHTMNARRRGPGKRGLWEYQVIPNKETENMTEQKITRRRLTDEEKKARAQSQIDMIEKRAAEKRIERVKDALVILSDLTDPEILSAQASLGAWLKAHAREG